MSKNEKSRPAQAAFPMNEIGESHDTPRFAVDLVDTRAVTP